MIRWTAKIQFARFEVVVPEGEVLGELQPPVFNFGEEGRVDFGGPPFPFVRVGVFVERATEDGFAGKRPGNLRPLLCEVGVFEKHDAGSGGFVVLVRPDAAIVHSELFKVREDRKGQFGAPAVTAKLIRGAGVAGDVDGGLFGFEKEFPRAANAKAVVGSIVGSGDPDGFLVNDVFVSLRVALAVAHVPAEGSEKRDKEFAAKLRLFIVAAVVLVVVLGKPLDQTGNFVRKLFLGRRVHVIRIVARRLTGKSAVRLRIANLGVGLLESAVVASRAFSSVG